MPRVPLKEKSDLAEDYQYLFETSSLGERNILRAMGNQPKILQSYMRYGSTLWTESPLSLRERELLILMVARTLCSKYEWHQHVDLAQEAGIVNNEINSISIQNLDMFADKERIMLEYAQQAVNGIVNDQTHKSLNKYYENSEIVGITALVSHYVATDHLIKALDIPIEDDFVGWELKSLK